MGYHGYPRATADMDIWIRIDPPNAENVVSALMEFGFDTPQLSADLFLRERQIVRMGVPPVQLEIITSASGVDFDSCYQQRVVGEIDGVSVNIIDLKQLKANKRASGRYKALDDLEHLP